MHQEAHPARSVPRSSVLRELPLGAVAVVFYVALLALHAPDLTELTRHWGEATGQSHGWVVLIVVPLLLWVSQSRLDAGAAHAPSGNRHLLPIAGLVATAVGTAVAHAAGIGTFALLGVPVVLFCALWLRFGIRSARAALFPLGYFLLALPIWAMLIPFLQWLTVKASVFLLHIAGVPTLVDGIFIGVPAGKFVVEESCSGLAFLTAALVIVAPIGFIERLAWWRSAVLTGTAVLLTLVMNWIRVAVIIYIGNATDMRSPLVADHYTVGWWMFAIALVPLMFLAHRLVGHRETAARPPHPRVPLSAALAPALILLALGPLWVRAMDLLSERNHSVVSALATPRGWNRIEQPPLDWQPVFPGARTERFVTLARERATVDVYMAMYERQEPHRKLVGYASSVLGEGWRVVGNRRLVRPSAEPRQIAELETINPLGQRRVIWMWYEVRGERTLSPIVVKLRQSLAAFGLPNRSAIIALSARCDADCTSARAANAKAYIAGVGGWTVSDSRSDGDAT